MPQTTEYDPVTLKRVPNHDQARRQKELDAALERLGIQNAQTAQAGQPGPQGSPASVGATNPNDPISTTVIELPDPTPSPAPPQATIQPAAPPAPASPSPAAPAVPTPEEWAKLEKRRRDAESALTPWMQKAAAAQNELKEEKEATKIRLDSLERNIANLVQALQNQAAPKAPIYNPENDSELNDLDPIIAVRFKKMHSAFDQRLADQDKRHQDELQAIRDQEAKRVQDLAVSQASSYEQTWNDTFIRLVPDYMRFIGDSPEATALTEWSRRMPLEYGRAIARPKEHSPHFVAKVVDEFKATLNPIPVPARQPSLGDLANAQLGGTGVVELKAPEIVNPLSQDEIRNAQSILDRLYRDATDTRNKGIRESKLRQAEDFLERYKRQLQSQ